MKKYKGLKTLEVLEGADNYNSWIANRLKKYIKSPALEIGAGIGNISQHFHKLNELVLTDIDEALVNEMRTKFLTQKNISYETLDIQSNFSKVKSKFNTVFSVNVLEHIKDDEKALKNMYKLLNEKGRVVILVPAKKFAYKKLDKRLGHFRRYEKSELKEKIENAGFKVEQIEYFNVVGLLSWIIRDAVSSKNTHLKPQQVKLFDFIVPLLRKLEPTRGLPIGISLIAVGVKR